MIRSMAVIATTICFLVFLINTLPVGNHLFPNSDLLRPERLPEFLVITLHLELRILDQGYFRFLGRFLLIASPSSESLERVGIITVVKHLRSTRSNTTWR
ncbi:hypothetical protein C8R42DRAFT_650207 [Lentinula raphanica]|nr:hypothetical protein C8R42DRAFT_650207 [Lentinula raphanica]